MARTTAGSRTAAGNRTAAGTRSALTSSGTITLSGNELTDATRATGTQGDGQAAPSGYSFWEATTNLVTNGGFQTNTTGWTTGGTNTIARSTTQFKFGTHSLLCTYQDNATLASFGITLTAAAHTYSAWVYVPTAYNGTQPQLQFTNFAGATGTLTADINLALRDQWQRIVVRNVTIVGGDLAGNIVVAEAGSAPTAGRFIYLDGVQVEQRTTVSPYVETDGGTASRSAARGQLPYQLVTPQGNNTQGWIAARVRPQFATGTVPNTSPRVFQIGTLNTNRMFGTFQANVYRTERDGLSSSEFASQATTFTAGSQTLIVISAYTSTQVKTSIDGVAFTATNGASLSGFTGLTVLDIGSAAQQLASREGDLDMFWIIGGTGTLTDANAATIASYGATAPTIGQMQAGLGVTAQPTFVWNCTNSTYQVAVRLLA